MDYTKILESLVGTSPFVTFLVWYILSERKIRLDDKKYAREKQDKHDEAMKSIIKDNQKIILANTSVMDKLGNKYEELKKIVEKGFTEINKDIKDVYKRLGDE